MAIAATNMSQDQESNNTNDIQNQDDQHEHDMVMPGFRFHPTEEELIEFYLRRKIEGKRFNVELITFLDLYRYDPWELPAMAAIGEKEWFFYVPRDRKYRNGDRPNRVTTSGYWKATGADRTIKNENSRSIGLKKTLVFYSGKAPKGIRTSWIMNEYRLPHHETERLQKAEISLCRVYKRPGVEDHPCLPRSLHTRASSSKATRSDKTLNSINPNPTTLESFQTFGGQSQPHESQKFSEISANISNNPNVLPPLVPNCNTIDYGSSSLLPQNSGVDDLHKLVNFQQSQQFSYNHIYNNPSQISNFPQQLSNDPQLVSNIVSSSFQPGFADRLWQWNSIMEGDKNFNPQFK